VREPLTKTHYDERLSYEHSTVFSYTAHTDRSTLYPDGIVGPVSATSSDDAPPLYSKLTRTIDLEINYLLQSERVPVVDGEMNVTVTVSAEDGWSQLIDSVGPFPFAGNSAQGSVAIDVQQVQALINTIQEETGYRASNYHLAIVPTISVDGQIGGEPIEDVYVPEYIIQMTSAQVVPPLEFQQNEAKSVGQDVVLPETVSLLGMTVTVKTARWILAVGLAIALSILGLLAAMVFLGLGANEADKVRARYRSLLIEVDGTQVNDQHHAIVNVASMRDLARLAQRDGRMIFHHLSGQTQRRFFVTDGTTMYQYCVDMQSEGV